MPQLVTDGDVGFAKRMQELSHRANSQGKMETLVSEYRRRSVVAACDRLLAIMAKFKGDGVISPPEVVRRFRECYMEGKEPGPSDLSFGIEEPPELDRVLARRPKHGGD